jgi:hypothetical protein
MEVCNETCNVYGNKIADYRVSTITCNARIGAVINMTAFFENVNIIENTDGPCGPNGFIWIEYGKHTRGVYPKVRKELGAARKCFDNQVTVIYKMRAENGTTYYPNIKVFRNGSIQMTGIRTKDDGELAAKLIADEVERMRHSSATQVVVSESTTTDDSSYDENTQNKIVSTDFTIRMINCDFGVPFKIRRKKLHLLLISPTYNNVCSFQPVDYPGVKLQYFWNSDTAYAKGGMCMCPSQCFGKGTSNGCGQCKKVTVSVFDSGKILITGANSFYQVNSAFNYIKQVIYDNCDEVKKTVPMVD